MSEPARPAAISSAANSKETRIHSAADPSRVSSRRTGGRALSNGFPVTFRQPRKPQTSRGSRSAAAEVDLGQTSVRGGPDDLMRVNRLETEVAAHSVHIVPR